MAAGFIVRKMTYSYKLYFSSFEKMKFSLLRFRIACKDVAQIIPVSIGFKCVHRYKHVNVMYKKHLLHARK